MCIDALYKASTIRNNVCLFACPYEIQVRKIFERLNELISGSPILKKTVVSNTKNPFQISFSNGSSIKGFTTGAASGGGADNIRGQRADAIYLDESDYRKQPSTHRFLTYSEYSSIKNPLNGETLNSVN